MEYVENLHPAPPLAVIHQVPARRKTTHAPTDVLASVPRLRVLTQNPEALRNRIDQSLGRTDASPLRPVKKDPIQIPLGVLSSPW